MAKNRTRRSGRGIVSRVFNPVGVAVNAAGTIVKNVFKGAKSVGHHAVKGANKVISSVGSSFKGSRRGRRGSTRRRKN